MSLTQRVLFLQQYVREPEVVGAMAPSSRALARALCEPYQRWNRPARVLEVGAGTGAITRHLGRLLGEQDELDICEVAQGFADILERDLLTKKTFASAVAGGRVRLFRVPIQELTRAGRYDFVISGLPFTAFTLADARAVLATIRRSLRPGGVLSYFEYIGLRKASRLFSFGSKGIRIRGVSALLSENIRNHQFDRKTVLRNFPPAYARHLRFDVDGAEKVSG